MVGWEYDYLVITNEPLCDRRLLEERGQAGWELVGMTRAYYWLKRRIPKGA